MYQMPFKTASFGVNFEVDYFDWLFGAWIPAVMGEITFARNEFRLSVAGKIG